MKLQTVETDGWVMSLSGEVDADNCDLVSEGLLAAERSAPTLHLDTSELSFLDSSGISALLNVKSALQADGHDLCLTSPTSSVLRVLEITGLLEMFGLADATP